MTPAASDTRSEDRSHSDHPAQAQPIQAPARRRLRFSSMADVLEEVESFQGVPLAAAGRWTPAQNIEHVRLLIAVSLDGTSYRMPLGFRVLGRVLKSRLLASGLKPGLKTTAPFEPREDITLEQAIAAFREDARRALRAGAMTHPSPLLGPMTHTQWERLHCRHAELHFSFIVLTPQA